MTTVRVHKDIAMVLFLACMVVTLYSVWGSYILSSGETSQQIAVVER